MQHRILLALAFLYLVVSNIIWTARDTRPPFWDMAAHESGALHVYDAFAASGPFAIVAIPLQHLTGYYPPFYHSVIAAIWSLFGKTVRVARLANVVAIAILMLSTYGIGCFLLEPWGAAIGAVLVSFYPIMLWLSRETMIDYWLTAMVAVATWMLFKTHEFSSRGWSIAFGVVAGLGMLTKWTFPFFVILPAVWFARRNWRNAAIAAAIAATFTAYWYIPSTPALREFSNINAAGGVSEGDPERLSIGAVLFYIRALEGYQLFFPLFVAFIAGAVILKKRLTGDWIAILLWIVGGWLGLMLFRNKDPRYDAPLLPAVALITALAFERRRVLTAALLLFLGFQHYLVSFGIRTLPQAVVLMKGVEGPLSWDWNLYTQSYFGLWGRPAREDWKIEHVLQEVCAPNRRVQLGLVPDIPRFDSFAFQFYIDLLRLPVHLRRNVIFDEPGIVENDYVLIAETDLPHSAASAWDHRINSYILSHPEKFQMVERFPLPSGDVIQLYRVQ
jgi:4-amino-4-deoxy-L-arabinose transferase-like glycosyltransferase